MSIKQDLIDSSFLAEQLKDLNEKYRNLSVHDRIGFLYDDFSKDEIMLTSSFAATSAMLLKFFSDVNKSQLTISLIPDIILKKHLFIRII